MYPSRLAFVDVETTGMRPFSDRVIEVGIIRVENGKIIATYNKLINPQAYIHPSIQVLTGINPELLENAPTFDEEKDTIRKLLDDTLFVAHNARFDYTFLKSEFSRLQVSFSSKQLCTAKLSRLLYPRFKHHNLSKLIERFGFICKKRHRAYDDAHVLWQFYQKVTGEIPSEKLTVVFDKILKRPSIPSNLHASIIDNLPQSPGVYEFYDKDGALLYIGKALNVKMRVLSHFASDHSSSKEFLLSRQVADIRVTQTAGELGALLLESQMIKSKQPLYNRQLRNARELIFLRKITSKEGMSTIAISHNETISPYDIDELMGVFKSNRQAMEFLTYISEKYSLCKKILGIEHGRSSCFGFHLGTCKGACIGEERKEKYNMRFLQAFAENKIKPWYFDKPIEIVETSRNTGKSERFVLDKWCILSNPNSIRTYPNDPKELNEEHIVQNEDYNTPRTFNKNYLFDIDTYKIIVRYLNQYYFNNKRSESIAISIKTLP